MYAGLDGLRAIAFLMVFLLHADNLGIGWAGVQLFFVLSGFLITGILLDMKKNFPRKDYFVKFYGRRFLRIFPLYYFYLFAMLALTFGLENSGFAIPQMELFRAQFPFAVSYIYNFFWMTSTNLSNFLSHFWSLCIEEQFYIVWPLLIFLVPERQLKNLFVAAIAGGLLFRLGFTLTYQIHPFSFVMRGAWYGIYALPFSHIDAFGFGAYISRFQIPKADKQLAILIILVPLVGYISQFLSTGSMGSVDAFGYPFFMKNGFQYVWGYSLLDYLFVLVISAVIRGGGFWRLLSWKPLAFLGKISYGLYVYHLAVVWFVPRLLTGILTGQSLLTKTVLTVIEFCITLLVSVLSYFLLEKPVLSLKDRFFAVHDHNTASIPKRS
ncbi:MAG TPA: acyltransferase [Anaerolineales bacterium]|nr:acyltransferase [Anaerolineales bacterium]